MGLSVAPFASLCALVIVGAGLFGCGPNRLGYQAGEREAFLARPGARALSFDTASGAQTAYYLGPSGQPAALPRILALAYPGIGSRALDWAQRLAPLAERGVGVLLLDYPGRGASEGSLRPARLPQTSRGALAVLERDWGALPGDLRLLGHSFGSGAALQFAAEEPRVRALALIAPFSTLRRAAVLVYGPLGWLLPENLDNHARLSDLKARTLRPAVTLYHGDADETLPVEMSRKLAEENADWVTYRELSGAGHTDVIDRILPEALDLLSEPR